MYYLLTMWICYNCSTCFRASAAEHIASKFFEGLFLGVLGPFVVDCQLLFEKLIEDEVDHGLTNAPIRGCYTFPKTKESLKHEV